MIKTSLIIPVWNAELTIKDCILSAIKANQPPSEIIVVDVLDASESSDPNHVTYFSAQ